MFYLKLLGKFLGGLVLLAWSAVWVGSPGGAAICGLLMFALLVWCLASLVRHLRGEQLGLDSTPGNQAR